MAVISYLARIVQALIFMRISTQRLLLRPAEIDDLGFLHAIFSNRATMEYWSWQPHSSVAETVYILEDMVGSFGVEGADFVVEYEAAVIGTVGFSKFPEIGFIFHPSCWRSGFATEAVSAAIEYGFFQKKLPEIVADVDPRNTGSIRVLEKLGFQETHRETKTILVGDVWYNSAYFNLKRSDI